MEGKGITMRFYSFFLICVLSSVSIWAESNTAGPNSPVVVGTLKFTNGKVVEVQTKDFLRKLQITDKTKIFYVSFLSKEKVMKPGYGVKAKQADGKLKSIHITLPINNHKKANPEMLKMTSKQLFAKADLDKSGEVSYVEFSSIIYRSDKHGPDTFGKVDKDKSGGFSLKEFEGKMAGVVWWRISRKSSSQWLKEADKNSNGKIALNEFNYIANSGSHYKEHFKRADKNKSNDLNAEEVADYVKSKQNSFK